MLYHAHNKWQFADRPAKMDTSTKDQDKNRGT